MSRHFGLRSERHAALDTEFPPDTPAWLKPSLRCTKSCQQGRACDCISNIEEETMLPIARRVISGRTFPQMWDAASYGSAVERPSRRSSKVWDIACWIAAFALLAVAFSAPYWWAT